MLWEHLDSNSFPAAVEASKGVCIVPVGCIEKHGPHAPLGTDTIIAADTARFAAEKEYAVVFPTMYFGEKSGAGEYPGTIIFSLETLWHIFRETCKEIHRNGFKKILFVNGHGGNRSMLDSFSRCMMEEYPEIMIFNTVAGVAMRTSELVTYLDENQESYPYLTKEDHAALADFVAQKKISGHAGLQETARVLYFRPETIDLSKISAEDGVSTHLLDEYSENKVSTPFTWMASYPNSYEGSNDYILNERIARAFGELSVEKLAQRIRFVKNETTIDAYHAQWLKKQK